MNNTCLLGALQDWLYSYLIFLNVTFEKPEQLVRCSERPLVLLFIDFGHACGPLRSGEPPATSDKVQMFRYQLVDDDLQAT